MKMSKKAKLKYGCFSSSGIHVLIKEGRGNNIFSAPALTYINEKNGEFKTQRSYRTKVATQPIMWGHVMEKFCFIELGVQYEPNSLNQSTRHFEFPYYWTGCVDSVFKDGIAEVKSYGLKKFVDYADCLITADIELFKKNFPQEYWQIVSGSVLEDATYGEAVAFMPYKDDLESYRAMLQETDFMERNGWQPWEVRFILERTDLPYIEKENSFYKNITKFRFIVPQADKDFLTERVELAAELLIKKKYIE